MEVLHELTEIRRSPPQERTCQRHQLLVPLLALFLGGHQQPTQEISSDKHPLLYITRECSVKKLQG